MNTPLWEQGAAPAPMKAPENPILEVEVEFLDGPPRNWERARISETPVYVMIADLDSSTGQVARIPWTSIRVIYSCASRWA